MSTGGSSERVRRHGLQPMPAGWLTELGERSESCETHGAYASIGRRVFRREVWTKCPACAKEAEAAELAEEERKRNGARQERLLTLIRQAAIPPRFEDRTFDTFIAETDEQRHALAVARAYADGFDEVRRKGQNLVFIGKTGTGKTHLACAILRSVLDQGRTGMYTGAMRLIRTIRDTWRRDAEATEAGIMRQLERIDLLVLDEIGAQYGTGAEQLMIGEVIERRYELRAPTILLGNETLRGIRACIGDRAYDRMRECAKSVAFEWESYRGKVREWE